MPEQNNTSPLTPQMTTPQVPTKTIVEHKHGYLYLILAIVGVLAIGAGILIAIKNFNTEQDVLSTQIPEECNIHTGSALSCSRIRAGLKNASSTTSQIDMSGWKTYTNSQYGFELKYPQSFLVSDQVQIEPYYQWQISQLVSFTGKDNYIDAANFSVSADNSSKVVSTCLQNIGDPNNVKNLTQIKSINGIDFYVLADKSPDDAMGGQRGSDSEYHILHNNSCYMLSFNVSWHEVGYAGMVNNGQSDATPQETQAQARAVSDKQMILEDMLATFKFTTPDQPAKGTEGAFCGGIATGAFPCNAGLVCKLDGNYPDAGGKCVKQ